MKIDQIICNITQMFQFLFPCEFVNILIQIRQKTAIVSILHNKHVLFCLWVLCDSIKIKESIITCALDMISELLNKNKYSVRLSITNGTLINATNYCLPRK